MRKRARTFVTGLAAGAGIAYFLDPNLGAARRSRTRDRLAGKARRASRKLERGGRWAGAEAYGIVQKVAHPRIEQAEVDDMTLKARVETEILGPEFPKGAVNFDVVDGVVTVRGQLEHPEDIRELGRRIARIPGVGGVENLVHMPGQSPPNKAEARRASREATQTAPGIQHKTG